jgi:hypothetical protein
MTATDRMVVWLREAMDTAEREAEAATAATGGPHWRGDDSGLYGSDVANHPGPFLADAYGYTEPRIVGHVVRHDPAAVLRRIAADRKLLEDLLADPHFRNEEDNWYTCAALMDEAGEPVCLNDSRAPGPCDCGRDARVQHRVRLIAEGYGWTEETGSASA